MTAPLYPLLRERLVPFGQEHVLRWWWELEDAQRSELARQIEAVDLAQVHRLFHEHAHAGLELPFDWDQLEPPEVVRPADTVEAWEQEQQAWAIGEQALRQGRVAICLVAGGQGSRLGHDAPKGTFPIGPITQRSLFQVHAQKVLALSRRYEVPLRWYIMTSPDNDAATRQFFAEHGYFGLPAEQVEFFVQGTMPAVDKDTGRLLMRSKWQLALSPDGHGGFLRALRRAGILDELQQNDVRWLFYFQVDNPLVKVADPLFLGQHISRGAEVSVKVVRRRHAQEKLGQVVRYRGRYYLVEYTEIPPEWQQRRDPSGNFWLDAGNIAVHIFDVAFLQRVAECDSQLPYHRAVKKVPFINEAGECVEPDSANALKWERFIFDVLPLAQQVLVVETDRAEEFEPLKNACGENSPETVRAALCELYARWLEQAGLRVPRDRSGRVSVPIEISPLVALDASDLRGQVEHLGEICSPLLLEHARDQVSANSTCQDLVR
ncbi:MAG: UDPGP type 1 family protein [Gemmatales bacterium]|nr:UDPGP type 1 family protein [Gemmatales bacterium]MCS7159973.1 UDPGP type 1 family protein [Gemmatales bacterium]MDW8175172.1 UDPGP type 1 family protein [Gemmatales bacterium]MDW8223917.1 UDPGP type 1 family protein [Gemmatales bacterium]